MRRFLAGVGVTLLTVVSIGSIAAASNRGTYADNFQSWSYSGSTGTLDWEGPWYEWNDDGDSSTGAVHVDRYAECPSDVCVHIENELLTGLGKQVGLKRYADASVFDKAEIYYSLSAESLKGIGGKFLVQVSNDSGGTWATIEEHKIRDLVDKNREEKTQIPEEYLCDQFAVRFLVSALLGGYLFLDDVVIEGDLIEGGTTTTTSTTTTTTKPTTTTTEPTTTTTESTTTTEKAHPTHPTSTTRPERTTTTRDSTSTTDEVSTDTSTSVSTSTSSSSSTFSSTPTTDSGGATTTSGDTSSDDDRGVAAVPGQPPSGGGPDFGLRQSQQGLQAGMSKMMFMEVPDVPAFEPVDAVLSFSLVTEVVETSWLWMVLFGLVLAWAIISDMNRRHVKGVFGS